MSRNLIMKTCILIKVLIWSITWTVTCNVRRKESKTTQVVKDKGESIAVNNLIQKYEKEHKKFYEEGKGRDNYLKWPAMDNKDLSIYCKKYLQHSIPKRNTNEIIGHKVVNKLHYKNENARFTNVIDMVRCKFTYKCHSLVYFITRAPEPNCVYSLKRGYYMLEYIFRIINKHCDFEDKLLTNSSSKRKRLEITDKIHRSGQPIAIDEYLLKYELEHQEMVKKEGVEGKHIEWYYAMVHPNLDSYCFKYMKECAPHRNHIGVTGSWKTDKLFYQKLNTYKYLKATIITCTRPNQNSRQCHITKAPESNCVYAVLRKGRNIDFPLVIIYKHCDFDDEKEQQNILQHEDLLDKNVIAKPQVKEELLNTLQLLPID